MAGEKEIKARKMPVQDRSRNTVDTILEAAAQVLEARGYAGATTNHIAQRAGVSIGSLYQYFPNKEAIVFSLMDAHMEESASTLDGLMGKMEAWGRITPGDVRGIVTAAMDLHIKAPGVHRTIVLEIPFTGKLWWESFLRMEQKMADRLQALMDKTPEVRKVNTRASSRLVIRVLESLTHRQVMNSEEPLEEEEFVEETTDMVCRYLFQDSRE
ncbi:MAG: TetR/AcrR family transcriptional regulator [Desulfatibacillum sp.]|nr:TetR/AcrR family transcriptional regulator [Desulfatibacillum sp.]